jgi:hypothetical protein
MVEQKDNGLRLRELIEKAGMMQMDALALFNRGQTRKYSESQWKAFLAKPDSKRRSPCPDAVLERAIKIFRENC